MQDLALVSQTSGKQYFQFLVSVHRLVLAVFDTYPQKCGTAQRVMMMLQRREGNSVLEQQIFTQRVSLFMK